MKITRSCILIYTVAIFVTAGCGGAPSQPAGTGAVAIKVTNARSFNPNIEHGRIERYRVKIEGELIAEPIIAEFPGDAAEGIVEGVPAGGDRMVSVEAINPNDAIIRAGEITGVEVGDGETAVEVALEAVPVFTNLTSGSSIDNTRLVFRLFSDPGHSLVIEDAADASADKLVDTSTNLPEINLDEATGMGRLAPMLLAPGEHRFVVRDVVTGRSSEVSAHLLDGSKRQPAPFVAAGMMSADGVSRVVSLPGFNN